MSKRNKNDQAETVEQVEESTAPEFHSKSEQRRIEHMQTAGAVSKVTITARRNVVLPGDIFVREGETVEVSKEYADRLVVENDNRFIINN